MPKKFYSFPITFHFYALPIWSGPRKKVVKLYLKVLSASLKWKSCGKAVPEVCPTRKILAEQWDYFKVLNQIESENF